MKEELKKSKRIKIKTGNIVPLLWGLLIITFLLSILIGRYPISISELGKLFMSFPDFIAGHKFTDSSFLVFYNVRLPRILLAITVGGVLAGVGMIFQNLFRNPLASPDVLGVTSGACFGAALGILLPISWGGIIQISAFVFGIMAIILTYYLKKLSKNDSILMLVLSGIIISAFFSSLLSLLKYLADPYEELPAIVFWMMGGFHRASWSNVKILLITMIPCLIMLYLLSFKVNILSLGDEQALSLGISVKKLRLAILAMVSFMIAMCVSVTGTISWIALVIPHLVRLLIGSSHKDSLLATCLLGGIITLGLDDIARTITTSEIPIGILTSLVGVPIFGGILVLKKGNLG